MSADDGEPRGEEKPSVHHQPTMASGGTLDSAPGDVQHASGSAVPREASAAGSPGGLPQAAPKASDKLSISYDRFIENLAASGLLSSDDLAAFRKSLPPDSQAEDADSLARLLVSSNRLTPYQVRRLGQGQTAGLVFGNYIVLDELGAGGMGVVYLARHRRMKRLVALKVLPGNLTASGNAVTRFHREVEAAAKLSHPNIVAAYDADEAAGVHFLVMEYVDGVDLDRYVETCGPLPVPLALDFITQAARGLAHAHEQGIVHRDIKPSNLLLDKSGTIKILDMGLARIEAGDPDSDHQNLTQSGRVMGTVDFMAPEQALDAKRADHRADFYSLGCTLHYLTSGLTLSPEGSLAMKLLWHQSAEVPSLRIDVPKASKRLDALFKRLLAKRPDDRPNSTAEVLTELEACRREAGSVSPAERVARLDDMRRTPTDTIAEGGGQTSPDAPALRVPGELNRPTRADNGPIRWPQRGSVSAKRRRWAMLAVAGAMAVLVAAGAGWGAYRFGLMTAAKPKDEPQPAPVPLPLPEPSPETSTPAPVPMPEPAPESPDRQLVRRIVSKGGTATVLAGAAAARTEVVTESQIPVGDFLITGISLARLVVSGDELARLEGAAVRNLESLSLADTPTGDSEFARLAKLLPALASLDLSGTRITDATLAALVSYPTLRDLNLNRTAVSDAGLTELRPLTRLTNLYLTDTRVSDEGGAALAELTGLRRLALAGTSVTADAVAAIRAAVPDVDIEWDAPDPDREVARQVLALGGVLTIQPRRAGAEPVAVTSAANLPEDEFRVTEIDLSGNRQVDDAVVATIAELDGLTLLRVSGAKITPAALESLGEVASLTALDLGSIELPAEAVDGLRAKLPDCVIRWQAVDTRRLADWVFEQGGTVSVVTAEGQRIDEIRARTELPLGRFRLRAVNLASQAHVTDEGLEQLAGLSELESLTLAATGLTDAGMRHIAGLAGLRELDLSGTKLTDEAAPTLSRLSTLEHLVLADTAVGNEGVRTFRRLERLARLSLAGTQATAAALPELIEMPALVWLSLARLPADDAALPQLTKLARLRDLNVEGTKLSDAGVEELAKALPGCHLTADPPDPQRLAARWVLEQGGAVKLSDGTLVERNTTLPRDACQVASIDLADAGRLDLRNFSAIAACGSLAELDLSRTRAGDQELELIAGLVKLKVLKLSGSRITEEGLAALTPLAELESLDLSVSEVGGPDLNAIAQLPKLRSLNLRETRVDDADVRAIAQAKGLVFLDLGYNVAVSDTGIARLAELADLETLSLRRTGATVAGLAVLAKLPKLLAVDLSGTQLTDAGLAALAEHRELAQLLVAQTQITDGALEAIARHTGLKRVDVSQTKVTPEGLARLRAALPECRVAP